MPETRFADAGRQETRICLEIRGASLYMRETRRETRFATSTLEISKNQEVYKSLGAKK